MWLLRLVLNSGSWPARVEDRSRVSHLAEEEKEEVVEEGKEVYEEEEEVEEVEKVQGVPPAGGDKGEVGLEGGGEQVELLQHAAQVPHLGPHVRPDRFYEFI